MARPRSERATAAILAAARELLEERGLKALSVDAIAARAGVSKATIYRWWPSKAAASCAPPSTSSSRSTPSTARSTTGCWSAASRCDPATATRSSTSSTGRCRPSGRHRLLRELLQPRGALVVDGEERLDRKARGRDLERRSEGGDDGEQAH